MVRKGTTSTSTTSSGRQPIPTSFKSQLLGVEAPYSKLLDDAIAELHGVRSQSYRTIENKATVLIERNSSLSASFLALLPPAALQAEYTQLTSGTSSLTSALEELQLGGINRSSSQVHGAVSAIDRAFAQISAGVHALKRKGVPTY